MTESENYLYFLTGENFKYDEKSHEYTILNPKNMERLKKRLALFKLAYTLKQDTDGATRVVLQEIKTNKIKETAENEIKKFLFLFNKLLGDWLQIYIVNGAFLLDFYQTKDKQIVNEIKKIAKQILLEYEEVSFQEKNLIRIKTFSFKELIRFSQESEKHRIAFWALVTGLNFYNDSDRDGLIVDETGNIKILSAMTRYFSQNEITGEDFFITWLEQELAWLNKNGYFEYEVIKSSSDEISIRIDKYDNELLAISAPDSSESLKNKLQEASLLNPAPLPKYHFTHAGSLANCLYFLTGIKFIRALSGNFISMSVIKEQRFSYAVAKLKQLTGLLSFEIIVDKKCLLINKIDKEKLLRQVFNKLELGKNYSTILDIGPGCYALTKCEMGFNRSISFNNTEEIDPRLSVNKKIKKIELSTFELDSDNDCVWFDEDSWYKLACSLCEKDLTLLQQTLGAEFQRARPPLPLHHQSDQFENFVDCVKTGKRLVIYDAELNDRMEKEIFNAISYRCYGMLDSSNEILKKFIADKLLKLVTIPTFIPEISLKAIIIENREEFWKMADKMIAEKPGRSLKQEKESEKEWCLIV